MTDRSAALASLAEPVTVKDFLVWAGEQSSGHYELVHGRIVAMAPERVRHSATKGEAFVALRNAVRAAGLDSTVLPDGMTVLIDEHTAYEPDVVLQCGTTLEPESVALTAPTIVVEVLSPSTQHVDLSSKLADYFKVETILHYIILNPDELYVIHHARVHDGISTHIYRDGKFEMDPPGIELTVSEIFV